MRSSSATSFLPAVVAAATLALASSAFSPANAYSISLGENNGFTTYDIGLNAANDVGRTLDPIKWLVREGTKDGKETLAKDVSAEATITVDAFTSNSLSLTFEMKNTTEDFQASLTGLAFGVDPNGTTNAKIKSFTKGKVFDNFTPTTKFHGFKDLAVCVSSDGCNGGNIKNGLNQGQTDIFKLVLAGNFGTAPSVKLTAFPAKFQTQTGSFTAAGVPEPITVVGSGLALGFGALFKKEASKRRKKALVKS